MIVSATRRKYLVHNLTIRRKYQTFEIRLPNYVKMVTGIYINAPVHHNVGKVGTISFQTNKVSDVFLSVDIHAQSSFQSDDSQYKVFMGDFDIDLPYISGQIQKMIPLWLDGDGTFNGWYKTTHEGYPYPVRIILEYEEVEEVFKVN